MTHHSMPSKSFGEWYENQKKTPVRLQLSLDSRSFNQHRERPRVGFRRSQEEARLLREMWSQSDFSPMPVIQERGLPART